MPDPPDYDTFFMSLLFFISGLFVWRSLTRKGVRKYLGDQLKRLGIPFVIVVSLLMPLALYPAQLQIGQMYGVKLSYRDLWLAMIRAGFVPTGKAL